MITLFLVFIFIYSMTLAYLYYSLEKRWTSFTLAVVGVFALFLSECFVIPFILLIVVIFFLDKFISNSSQTVAE